MKVASTYEELIPGKNYAGYIFDCDGTLADSMELHYQAWTHALQTSETPVPFSFELMSSWGGMSMEETIDRLNRQFGSSLQPDEVRQALNQYHEKHLKDVKPHAATLKLARHLAQDHPVSVASGGSKEHVRTILRAIKADDIFRIVMTPEFVPRSKPAPDLFLEAAKRMGVDARQCLVYEDSPVGIEAAQKAGMDFIQVSFPRIQSE